MRKVPTNLTKPVLVSRKDFLVVVVVQFCVPGVPIEDGLGTVFRSAVQPILADVGTVTAKLGIKSQQLPGDREMVFADTEKSTETEHSVSDFAAGLVDHDTFNFTNLPVLSTVDSFPRLFIAGGQMAILVIVTHGHAPLHKHVRS